MKVRSSFVSNSSSSSFVLPMKNINDKFTFEFTLEDLRKAFDESDDSRVGEIISTKEALQEYYLDDYGGESWEDLVENDPWAVEEYEKNVKKIEAGYSLVMGSVSYHEPFATKFLTLMGAEVND